MTDGIYFEGSARNTKAPILLRVADIYTGIINGINADLMTHVIPRV